MRESLEGLASWEDVIWAVQAERVALKLKELDPGKGSYSACGRPLRRIQDYEKL